MLPRRSTVPYGGVRAEPRHGRTAIGWRVVLLSALTALGGAALPAAAQAQFKVESPFVEKGAIEFESDNAVLWGYEEEPEAEENEDDEEEDAEEEEEGDQRLGHELSLSYGVTGFWRPELSLELESEVGDSIDPKSIAFENTVELLADEDSGLGLALFGAYALPIDEDTAHAVEFGPILAFDLGPTTSMVNPFFEYQFGEDREDGVGFEYGWQTLVGVTDALAVGFEAFGEIEDIAGDAPDLDEQEHRIGPVASLELGLDGLGEVEVTSGILFGLTDATSDYAFLINFELEFGGGDDD